MIAIGTVIKEDRCIAVTQIHLIVHNKHPLLTLGKCFEKKTTLDSNGYSFSKRYQTIEKHKAMKDTMGFKIVTIPDKLPFFIRIPF
jgi:hypothetical protein